MRDYWDGSWVIKRRDTGEVVLETFDFEALQFTNLREYRVETIMQHLTTLSPNTSH